MFFSVAKHFGKLQMPADLDATSGHLLVFMQALSILTTENTYVKQRPKESVHPKAWVLYSTCKTSQ